MLIVYYNEWKIDVTDSWMMIVTCGRAWGDRLERPQRMEMGRVSS